MTETSEFIRLPATIVSSTSYYSRAWKTSGYKLGIIYEYEFNNKKYVSNKYSFGRSFFSNKDTANGIINEYNANSQILVFVNRKDPKISVININENQTVDFILLLVIVIAVILLLMRDIRKRWKKEDDAKLKRQRKINV